MDVLSVRQTCIFMEAWVWFSIQEQFTCQFCYHVLVLPSRSLTDIWSVVTLKTCSALICLTSLLIRPGAVWSLHWWFVVGLYGLLLGLVRVCIYIFVTFYVWWEMKTFQRTVILHLLIKAGLKVCMSLLRAPSAPALFLYTETIFPMPEPSMWLLGTVSWIMLRPIKLLVLLLMSL